MPSALHISPVVYEKIPDRIIVSGSIKGLDPDLDGIQDYLQSSWQGLSSEVKIHGHNTHPIIAQWRQALQKASISVKKYPPSIQAIAKRTIHGEGPFSINPIVDTYNAICMELVLPGGAYDTSQLEGGLQLRVSSGGEPFKPIGRTEEKPTTQGEIVYSDNVDVITRQFLWQQAEKGKITESTQELVFVFELLTGMGQDVLENTVNTIEKKFPALLNGKISNMTTHKL